jgi:hypothetical protein
VFEVFSNDEMSLYLIVNMVKMVIIEGYPDKFTAECRCSQLNSLWAEEVLR